MVVEAVFRADSHIRRNAAPVKFKKDKWALCWDIPELWPCLDRTDYSSMGRRDLMNDDCCFSVKTISVMIYYSFAGNTTARITEESKRKPNLAWWLTVQITISAKNYYSWQYTSETLTANESTRVELNMKRWNYSLKIPHRRAMKHISCMPLFTTTISLFLLRYMMGTVQGTNLFLCHYSNWIWIFHPVITTANNCTANLPVLTQCKLNTNRLLNSQPGKCYCVLKDTNLVTI